MGKRNVFKSFDSDPPDNTHKNSNFGTEITIGWKSQSR
jgi:hypothetical protein